MAGGMMGPSGDTIFGGTSADKFMDKLGAKMFGQSQYGGTPQGMQAELKRKEQLGQQLGGYGGAQIGDRGQKKYEGLSDQSRSTQFEAQDMIRDAAIGNAPSVAQNQMQQGLGMSAQNQLAMAAGARGGGLNQAAGMRTAQNVNSQAAANMVGQSAALRAQEMAEARNQYMQAATQTRAQDLMARGLSADEAYRQAGLDIQSHGLRQSGMLAAEDMRGGIYGAQLSADARAKELQAQAAEAAAARSQRNADRMWGMIGDVGKGVIGAI